MKLFEVDFRKGTLIDSVNKIKGIATDVVFKKADKGNLINYDNSTDSKVSFGDLDSWDLGTNDFTIACAFRYNKNDSVARHIFGKRGTEKDWLRIYIDASNEVVLEISITNGGIGISGPTLLPGKDYLVVATRKNGFVNFYVNNILVNSIACESSITNTGDVSFIKWRNETPSDIGVYYGLFYNHSITTQKINELYKEFLRSTPTEKEIKNIEYPKPTDLSSEVDSKVGIELVENTDFNIDSWWTKGTDWIISNGVASVNNTSGTTTYLKSQNIYITGKKYKTTIKVNSKTGSLLAYIGQAGIGQQLSIGLNNILINTNSEQLWIAAPNGTVAEIEYITSQEVSGLVAAYSFSPETVSNGKLIDISGNQNDGTIHGAILTKEGMKFDGVDDYVDLSNDSSLNITNELTITFRINKLSNNTEGAFISKYISDTDRDYEIRYNTVNKLRYFDSNNIIELYTQDLTITPHNIVIIRRSTSLECYIDGNKVYDESLSYNISGNTANVAIGSRTGGAEFRLNSELEDLKIYNYAFTPEQAKEYHNSFIKPTIIEDFSENSVGDTI